MKKFIFRLIYLSLPILITVASVNYLGDAAKLFHSDYEKFMAKIILNGEYVTNISNYNERIFQRELIKGMKKTPEVLVMGSSRTMQISSKNFPNSNFYNSSVSGASIEDLIALYQIYKENKLIPKRILIGIDPWTFNDNNNQSRWESISDYYLRFLNKDSLQEQTGSLNKYKQLLSLSYFQSSVKNIKNLVTGKNNPVPTKEKYNITNTKLIDGSLVYANGFREASQELINSRITKYLNGPLYSIEGFNEISAKNWSDFQKLVEDLQAENVNVEIFLCPYAPLVYKTIEKKYPMVLETERLVNEYAEFHKINTYGSFNPIQLDLDETYFYDGMHCKEKALKNIFHH